MAGLLVKDHEELDDLGRGLSEAFDRGDVAEVLTALDLVWVRLAVHIRAEHLHLFPALLAAAEVGDGRAAAVPSARQVEEALSRLREDHNFFMRQLAACVDAAKGLARGERPESAEGLEEIRRGVAVVFERLREHNRLEEDEVYDWPRELLNGAERDRLEEVMRGELENLPPRFAPRAPLSPR